MLPTTDNSANRSADEHAECDGLTGLEFTDTATAGADSAELPDRHAIAGAITDGIAN